MEIFLTEYAGVCVGVKRAIKIAHKTAEESRGPIFVLHEIVHNTHVVNDLANRGVHSVDDVGEVPEGTLIISAHGVSPSVIAEAKSRNLDVVDTTCPLVSKIHRIVKTLAEKNYTILLLGEESHDEVMGVQGVAKEFIHIFHRKEEIAQLPMTDGPVALVSQTTQSIKYFDEILELLMERYPQLEVHNTICDATEKRQTSALAIAGDMDVMITVGSMSSANSRRLQEVSGGLCSSSYLVDQAAELQPEWFSGNERVGVTAGASTPDYLIEGVIEKLKSISIAKGFEPSVIRNESAEEEFIEVH
ncbi:MAG: 4-hydroxy-3-methylbut-2-enyl diphosphate reductase [Nitrospirota bacterium]|nr:4-hydroxy-3-methylbut-2-enyl diphosphate reductase [Nitrospirota bacterium]